MAKEPLGHVLIGTVLTLKEFEELKEWVGLRRDAHAPRLSSVYRKSWNSASWEKIRRGPTKGVDNA